MKNFLLLIISAILLFISFYNNKTTSQTNKIEPIKIITKYEVSDDIYDKDITIRCMGYDDGSLISKWVILERRGKIDTLCTANNITKAIFTTNMEQSFIRIGFLGAIQDLQWSVCKDSSIRKYYKIYTDTSYFQVDDRIIHGGIINKKVKDDRLKAIDRFTPTIEEAMIAEKILWNRFEDIRKNDPTYYPNILNNLDNYKRQYIGLIDDKGNKIIWLNCIFESMPHFNINLDLYIFRGQSIDEKLWSIRVNIMQQSVSEMRVYDIKK